VAVSSLEVMRDSERAEYLSRYVAWLRFYRAHPEKLPRVTRTGLIRDVTHVPGPRRPYPPRA
jgi:hypothetical protein